MNHREFQRLVSMLADEIGGDGDTIASHSIPGEVYIEDEKGNTYSITHMELRLLPGCGCPDGIVIHIRRDEEESK